MESAFDDKLSQILARRDELQALLAEVQPSEYAKLAKEFSDLGPVVETIEAYRDARRELGELELLAQDPEMRDLADQERREVEGRLPELERQVRLLLLPKDADDEKSAILEIRAGTGGDEAALFAGDLFRMYQRYADLKGWRCEVLSLSESDLGGLKEVVADISGQGVFARLKYEAGVHRVQRVPVTEGSGRIHTSAATVAVLPEAEDVDIAIDDKDLRIDVYRASGAGGQHVNRTESAVRITHLPTGLVVAIQDEKSQHKNKAKALKILKARLYEQERAAKDSERAANRKGQVGSGDRSERIRTYNFPQNRLTDHRINLTLYKLDQVVAGEALDEVIEPLINEEQAALLAEAGLSTVARTAARGCGSRWPAAGIATAARARPGCLLEAATGIDRSALLGRRRGSSCRTSEPRPVPWPARPPRRARADGLHPRSRRVLEPGVRGRPWRAGAARGHRDPDRGGDRGASRIRPGPCACSISAWAPAACSSRCSRQLPATRGRSATDLAAAALACAASNAEALRLGDRVLPGPDRSGRSGVRGPFDLVVSNPPYIPQRPRSRGWSRKSRAWEPRGALDGGPDGLDAYRRLAAGDPGACWRPTGGLVCRGWRRARTGHGRQRWLRMVGLAADTTSRSGWDRALPRARAAGALSLTLRRPRPPSAAARPRPRPHPDRRPRPGRSAWRSGSRSRSGVA